MNASSWNAQQRLQLGPHPLDESGKTPRGGFLALMRVYIEVLCADCPESEPPVVSGRGGAVDHRREQERNDAETTTRRLRP